MRAGMPSTASAMPSRARPSACKSTWVNPRLLPEADARARARASRWSANIGCSILLRRPEVSYAGLMTLPGAGAGRERPEGGRAGRNSGQVLRATSSASRRRWPRPRRTSRCRCRPISTTARCVACPSKCSRSSTSTGRETLGQASRIQGVTPAAISLLLVHLKKRRKSAHESGRRNHSRLGPEPCAAGCARRSCCAIWPCWRKWNRTYNLTAIRDEDEMVTHHLLDSLAVLPHLDGAGGRAGRCRQRCRLAGAAAGHRATGPGGDFDRGEPEESRPSSSRRRSNWAWPMSAFTAAESKHVTGDRSMPSFPGPLPSLADFVASGRPSVRRAASAGHEGCATRRRNRPPACRLAAGRSHRA